MENLGPFKGVYCPSNGESSGKSDGNDIETTMYRGSKGIVIFLLVDKLIFVGARGQGCSGYRAVGLNMDGCKTSKGKSSANHAVAVSQNKGTPISTTKYYSPCYRDPQKGTPSLRKPPKSEIRSHEPRPVLLGCCTQAVGLPETG